jgi:hypothetical protein
MGSFTLHNNTARPAVFLAGGRRSFAIPLFCSTRTATWRMQRSSMHSGS